MNFKTTIDSIKKLAQHAQLIIVTKHQTIDTIKKVYELGEKDFGENKVQELISKKNHLPKDINWHMIGHLQRNKVKLIAPFIYMIQSVDSVKLLETINKYAEKNSRTIKCLIQIKISSEKSKFGFTKKDALKLLKSNYKKEYKYIDICGVMGMATLTNDSKKIIEEFKIIQNIFHKIKDKNPILSIGMSRDYKIAYQLESNMIRIGSSIFNKNKSRL